MPLVVNNLSYNFDLREIEIGLTHGGDGLELKNQDLVNATREVEATLSAMDDVQILAAEGKRGLGGGRSIDITVALLNGWRIKFADRAVPTVTRVTGGNLLAYTDDGTNGDAFLQDPFVFATNVYTYIAQSASPTAIETGAATAPECHLSTAYVDNPGAGRVKLSAWLVRGDSQVTNPTAVTIAFLDTDGTTMFTLTEVDAALGQDPDALGIYTFDPVAANLVASARYHAVVDITDTTGTVRTIRAIPTV
jgi:hypothetical protein